MSNEPVLQAADLAVRYRSEQAVRDVSIRVHQGEVVGLIGPDGAGKTSTLRVLAGLSRATSGEATALGLDCWVHRRALHHRLGYLAQRFALYGDLTVDENVQFFALLYGVRDWRQRRTELLERVGLAPFSGRRAEQLSGGMKQKLALACTLIHSPELLLLDEPTTGVDPVTRREFWHLLADLVADGLTLLVATPYLDEAERCTRVVLMHHGRVLADQPPGRIPELAPGTVVEVIARPRPTAMEALRSLPEVADLAVFGATLHARIEADGDAVPLVRAALENSDVEVTSVQAVRTSLEDAFLFLTRGSSTPAEAS